jgi:hypothetical protein
VESKDSLEVTVEEDLLRMFGGGQLLPVADLKFILGGVELK